MMAQYITALEDLIVHMWVHAGYPRCGYDQMTTAQKRIFTKITDRDFFNPRKDSAADLTLQWCATCNGWREHGTWQHKSESYTHLKPSKEAA